MRNESETDAARWDVAALAASAAATLVIAALVITDQILQGRCQSLVGGAQKIVPFKL